MKMRDLAKRHSLSDDKAGVGVNHFCNLRAKKCRKLLRDFEVVA